MGRPLGSKNVMPGIQAVVAARTPKAERRRRAIMGAKTRRKNAEAKLAADLAAEDQAVEDFADPSAKVFEQLRLNPLLWARYFCPKHFRLPSPPFHLELVRAVMAVRHLAVAAPRESSKSTLLAFAYAFHGLVFKRFRFIVLLSNTFTKSTMALETMKAELASNERLRGSFVTPIELVKDAEGDSEFSHPDGFTTKVLCKGADQIGSLRGVKFGAHRPDLILADDVEDDELVRNPERRGELHHLVDEALIPAGEVNVCQHVWIGTILHDDSQLAKLVKHEGLYPEFTKLVYQAHLDPDGPNEASLWPEKWTVEQLRALRADKPTVYAKEYQNDPVAGSSAVFRQEDFVRWQHDGARYVLKNTLGDVIGGGELRWCQAAVACDLAWKESREADFSVVVPGFLTPQSELLVDRYVARKGLRPDEIEEVLFSMVARLKALTGGEVHVGMEKAMLENVTQWLLKGAMRRRNEFIAFRELEWGTDKIERIKVRLQARYAQHVIYHLDGMGELEHQLVRFPSGAHDDLPDAVQGLVQLLQRPKKIKDEQEKDDPFMRVRQFAIDSKKRRSGLGIISHPISRRQGVPAQVAVLSLTMPKNTS